uniref:DUF1640 domain-containing protein n=1 Tax=Desulfacinum infernum TaxID=35837 RepID=A0A831ZME9_9BACT
MAHALHPDDALLEQKIAAVVHQILVKEGDRIFGEKIAAFVQENERRARELALMERVVRVEEELRALREIQIAHFNAAEKRFEAMDKRFEALQREMTARFEAQQREMTARFEAVDKRFEALQGEMAARFEAMDRRFEAMERRFRFQEWMIAGGVTLIVGLLTVLKIFSRALSARQQADPLLWRRGSPAQATIRSASTPPEHRLFSAHDVRNERRRPTGPHAPKGHSIAAQGDALGAGAPIPPSPLGWGEPSEPHHRRSDKAWARFGLAAKP